MVEGIKYSQSAILALDRCIRDNFERALKVAPPNRLKSHQLVKLMMLENEKEKYELVRRKVMDFYSIPYERRTAGQFSRNFRIRPYPWLLNQFHLNFSNALVTETQIVKIASSIRHTMINTVEPPSAIADHQFLNHVVRRLVTPRADEPRSGIEIDIFLNKWQACARNRWGDKFDAYFGDLTEAIQQYSHEEVLFSPVSAGPTDEIPLNEPMIRQSDLEWMKSILRKIESGTAPSRYPFRRPPVGKDLRLLDKVCQAMYLYQARGIQNSEEYKLLGATAQAICLKFLKAYNQLEEKKAA